MAVEIFQTNDGMLRVEKSNPEEYGTMPISDVPQKKVVNWNEIMDTVFSYQDTDFSIRDMSGSARCRICGAETGYANRYFCPSCWRRHEAKILSKMKQFTVDWSVEVE